MIKILNILVVFIALIIVACTHTNAAEMNEEEYAQLKNRLTSEFMQKLKDEIKNELITELKSEYTIEPKQQQEDKRKSQTVTTDVPKEEPTEEGEFELDTAHYKLGEGLSFGEQMLTIKGFGNVDARYMNKNAGESINQGDTFFSLGELDLFITSKLSNRISFFSETVFEFEFDSAGEVVVDVERLLIRYDINSLLKVDVGKFHTPIGYWNQFYHHGKWLQTTVDRPEILKFEDDGGPLPAHSTGIQLSGIAMFEGFDMNYVFSFSNGRGIDTSHQQNSVDLNDEKTIYYDIIPEDETNPRRGNEIREIIYGGHMVYFMKNIELLMEVFEINHDEFSGNVFSSVGGYAQCAYAINKFKSYYRYDYLNYDSKDPFYNDGEIDFPDTNMHTVGLRYDLSQFNALKCEFSHGVFDDEDANIIRLQTAFAF